MLNGIFSKVGLGLTLLGGCALLTRVPASAQESSPRVERVDHRDHDRDWDCGRRRDHWRDWDNDRDHWRERRYRYYPGYGSGLGFYFGPTPKYNYYSAPPYPPANGYYPTPYSPAAPYPSYPY
jgi:hypothetical protein